MVYDIHVLYGVSYTRVDPADIMMVVHEIEGYNVWAIADGTSW